ncbi:hypothetical protein LX36DRAFT_303724 [Colletotrichum falcatum]|nr:hypothetical protein LX36DRAFT_303724 [Colletotrichum falcatum]
MAHPKPSHQTAGPPPPLAHLNRTSPPNNAPLINGKEKRGKGKRRADENPRGGAADTHAPVPTQPTCFTMDFTEGTTRFRLDSSFLPRPPPLWPSLYPLHPPRPPRPATPPREAPHTHTHTNMSSRPAPPVPVGMARAS